MWNLSDAQWRRVCLEKNTAFTIGHEAFWSALSQEDLPDALRVELEAALYLLRHFELIYRPGLTSDSSVQQRLQELVQAVSDDPVRTLLSDLLSSLWLDPRTIVSKPLSQYAHSLRERGYWHLAQAVYDTIIEAWNDSESPCARCYIEARLYRASAARQMGQHKDSLRDYIIAHHYAASGGLFELMLQAIVGGSAATADGGAPHLGLRMALDAAKIAKTFGARRHEINARCNAGKILHRAGQLDLALIEFSLAYEVALEKDSDEEGDADTALASIAACAAECGYWKLASDTNELLASTSQSNYARQTALCNLLELYTWQRNEAAFYHAYERIQTIPLNKLTQDTVPVYYTRGVAVFSKTPLEKSELEPLKTFVSRSRPTADP